MRRLEIGGLALMVAGHVLDSAAPVQLADISLLSGDPAFRPEVVFLGIKFNLRHPGMRYRQ